jgi:hypothetical protein
LPPCLLASCTSNRHIPELESLVSHRKQRIGPRSNRHKFAFCNLDRSRGSSAFPVCPVRSRCERHRTPQRICLGPHPLLSTVHFRLPLLIGNETQSPVKSSYCKKSTYKFPIGNEFHFSFAGVKRRLRPNQPLLVAVHTSARQSSAPSINQSLSCQAGPHYAQKSQEGRE